MKLKTQEYDTTTGKLRVTERAGQMYYDAEAQTLDWMPNKHSPAVLALRECDRYDQTFTEAGVKCVPQPVLAGVHFRIGFLSSTERQGLVVQHIDTGFCLRFPDLTRGPCGDKENVRWSRGQNGATDSAEISASLYYPGYKSVNPRGGVSAASYEWNAREPCQRIQNKTDHGTRNIQKRIQKRIVDVRADRTYIPGGVAARGVKSSRPRNVVSAGMDAIRQ